MMFHDFLNEAENAALAYLAEVTGMVPGRNAFIGLSCIANSMMFALGDSSPSETAAWDEHALPTMPFSATATGYFSDRGEMMRWAARIIEATPRRFDDGPIELLRFESMGAPSYSFVKYPEGERLTWTTTLNLRVVARTGGRDEG